MFIELDENNNIIKSANFKFNDQAIQVDKEIIYKNGKHYFAEEQNNILETEKNQKILLLKQNISNKIFDKYPLTKQIDIIAQIGDYNNQDLAEMKAFINDKISQYKSKKSSII